MSDNKVSGKAATTVVASSLILSVAFGFLGGFVGSAVAEHDPWRGITNSVTALFGESVQVDEPVEGTTAAVVPEAAKGESLEDMVERVSPAVVSIVVSREVPRMEQVMVDPFGGTSFFRQFFGDGTFQIPQYRQNGTEEQRIGAGTGFLVSPDGYIVTNRHVVADEGADYTVIASDETRRPVKVLARDSVNDIAILKVEPAEGEKLPFMAFGDSDALRVGETVVAIGYALGQYDNSVSRGIVSGLRRRITAGGAGVAAESLFDLIQTDTAINPGNSGGPLLNLRGEVVGVNVAVDQGGQNIGFALPINEVSEVFESVKSTGKISRPWLGVRYVMIGERMIRENQLKVDHGALVVRGDSPTELAVVPGSPADKAGLRENDIILRVDGEDVTEQRPLLVALSRRKVGETVALTVMRQGEELELTVTLEARE